MPLYEYRCGEGHIFERVLPVAEYLSPQFCSCGEIGQKVILHPPRVFCDLEGYESPATGRWVEGKRARAEDLRLSGCRPYEAGEREAAEARKVMADQQLDRQIDGVVERTLDDMLNG